MRPKQLFDRELGVITKLRSEDLIDGADVIEKLDHYKTLKGHQGCVNVLKWNHSGSLLASGSDDQSFRIWGIEGDCECTYETSHEGNIFGLAFMNEDSYIMTCAADSNVILTNLETKQESWKQRCGESRLKQLASSTYFPTCCWSVSEDQLVRLHDTRHPDSEVKFDIGYSGKSIDVSELKVHWICVGSESTNVSIYDMRNTRHPILELRPLDMRERSPYYVTHVVFAKKSNSLLANYGRGSTYLFDLNDSSRESIFYQQLDQLRQTESNSNEHSEPPLLSTSVQNILEQVVLLIADLHYVDALTLLTNTLKREDLSACERAYLLLKRSTTFLVRKREGDSYAAALDTLLASILIPNDPQPIHRFITVLWRMEQIDLCIEIIDSFKNRFPDNIHELGDIEESLRSFPCSNRRDNNNLSRRNSIRDYSRRYVGHTNEKTDIKQAAFFGQNEEYIVCASDTGMIHIYNRDDSSIVTLLKGDNSIVNSVQPHPSLPLMASSGLDDDIMLFSPFNSSAMPHSSLFSHRISYADAEPMLTRHTTRNLVHELLLLNRAGVAQNGQESCRVS